MRRRKGREGRAGGDWERAEQRGRGAERAGKEREEGERKRRKREKEKENGKREMEGEKERERERDSRRHRRSVGHARRLGARECDARVEEKTWCEIRVSGQVFRGSEDRNRDVPGKLGLGF